MKKLQYAYLLLLTSGAIYAADSDDFVFVTTNDADESEETPTRNIKLTDRNFKNDQEYDEYENDDDFDADEKAGFNQDNKIYRSVRGGETFELIRQKIKWAETIDDLKGVEKELEDFNANFINRGNFSQYKTLSNDYKKKLQELHDKQIFNN